MFVRRMSFIIKQLEHPWLYMIAGPYFNQLKRFILWHCRCWLKCVLLWTPLLFTWTPLQVISLPYKFIIFVLSSLDFNSCLSTWNNISAYDTTKKHVLALEVDFVAFHKAFLMLVKQSIPKDTQHKVAIWIQIPP